MALIRPDNRPQDEPEDVQQLGVQLLMRELRQIKDGQNYLRVVLLGGNYQDVVHQGRLPQLEEAIVFERSARKLLDGRIEALEEAKKLEGVARRSAVKTAAAIGSGISTMLTGMGYLVFSYLRMRH